MLRWLFALGCAALALGTAGCNDSPAPPASNAQTGQALPVGPSTQKESVSPAGADCGSAPVLSVATEAFWKTVGKQAADERDKAKLTTAKPAFVVKFDAVRLIEQDKGSGMQHCAAQLTVSLTDAAKGTVPKEFKQSAASDVELTSQTTTDGKSLVVELAGHEGPAKFVWSLTSMGAFEALAAGR